MSLRCSISKIDPTKNSIFYSLFPFFWRSFAAAIAGTQFASCIFQMQHIVNNADRHGVVKSSSFSHSFHFTRTRYLWGPFSKRPYNYVMMMERQL